MNESLEAPIEKRYLSEHEKAQLRLWAEQTTPAQRLAWLEEALQFAASAKAGARFNSNA